MKDLNNVIYVAPNGGSAIRFGNTFYATNLNVFSQLSKNLAINTYKYISLGFNGSILNTIKYS